jgi:hypothetical protein
MHSSMHTSIAAAAPSRRPRATPELAGLLEDSYRRWGVKQGWMDGKDFLRLSRQVRAILLHYNITIRL